MPETRATQSRRCRLAAGVVLACYWASMFIATHWPHMHVPNYVQNTDKILHFAGNFGFGFLLAIWISTKRTFGRGEFAAAFGVIFVYAIVDEVTQIPVGRDCEFFDMVADWCGGLTGLLAFLLLRLVLRRLTRSRVDEVTVNAGIGGDVSPS
jgi:VanZ family protein